MISAVKSPRATTKKQKYIFLPPYKNKQEIDKKTAKVADKKSLDNPPQTTTPQIIGNKNAAEIPTANIKYGILLTRSKLHRSASQ
ncbi:hypothetical protein [Metapseudomonas otitidis]|uniref:hypothetical protein n=1 Tax=Metapseudomonas otitidis TaxID=319939 RepID=UPI001CA3A046|nr:hypothetical protein [Pseudomonas otitidis]QZX81607.1 hypothetical protein K6751_20320 [Pseudomonas otitidis]